MLKKPLFSPARPRRAETRLFPYAFSLHSEAQRTEAYASPLRTLRPCWTAFLSILRGVLLLSQTCRPVKFCRAHRVFPQPPNQHQPSLSEIRSPGWFSSVAICNRSGVTSVAIFIRLRWISFLSPAYSEKISSKLAQFWNPSLPAGKG